MRVPLVGLRTTTGKPRLRLYVTLTFKHTTLICSQWSFSIPSQTPSGRYLIHIGSIVNGRCTGPVGTDRRGT
jgi:hypothetical protein